MLITRSIACLSLVSVLAACEPAGRYDANGNYHAYNSNDAQSYNDAYATTRPVGGVPTTGHYPDESSPVAYGAPVYVTYTRPGYYDYNGYYIATNNGPRVAKQFFPPRGMCRVWFTDRPATEQPGIESCDGIQRRVPAGAYVIYGG